MNRILLIVEGEKREKDFFEQYKKVKKISDDLEIVPFCQNIKELFQLSKDYIFSEKCCPIFQKVVYRCRQVVAFCHINTHKRKTDYGRFYRSTDF